MGDLQTLRKEAKRFAEEFPNYPWVDENSLSAYRVWCRSVAEWAYDALDADDLCACILVSSMNHVVLEPGSRARKAYDEALDCLSDGYDLLIARAEGRDVKWPKVDPSDTEFPFAQTLGNSKNKEIASLPNPYSHWQPDMFPKHFESRDDPFLCRVLLRLREARLMLEKQMDQLLRLGGDDMLSYGEASPFLDLDDTPHGKGTRWQECYRKVADECADGIELTIPWFWFGIAILAYRNPPDYSLFRNVGRNRLERLREDILNRPEKNRDASFFESVRDALLFFSASNYTPEELIPSGYWDQESQPLPPPPPPPPPPPRPKAQGMPDFEVLRKEAAELHDTCPWIDNPTWKPDELSQEAAAWESKVVLWLTRSLGSKEYGQFVLGQMRWFLSAMMPNADARVRYDKLVNMLHDGWNLVTAVDPWEAIRYSANTSLVDPFSQWYPDAFGAEIQVASNPLDRGAELFAVRLLNGLSGSRKALEVSAATSLVDGKKLQQISDPDDTLPGNYTPWQENYWWLRDHLINSAAACHAVPWSRLCLYLLGYGEQPYYSFLKPIGRKRQESVRAKIRSDGDYRYEWAAREALETICKAKYWETLVLQDEAPSALPCPQQDVSPEALETVVDPAVAIDTGQERPAAAPITPAPPVPAPSPVAGPADEAEQPTRGATPDQEANNQIHARTRICPSTSNLDALLEETLVALTPMRIEDTEDREATCKYQKEVFEAFLLSLQRAVDSADQGQWQKACTCIERLFAHYLQQRLDKDMVFETMCITSPDDISEFYRDLFKDIFCIPKFCEIGGKLGMRTGMNVQGILSFGNSDPEDRTQQNTLARSAMTFLHAVRMKLEHDAKQAEGDGDKKTTLRVSLPPESAERQEKKHPEKGDCSIITEFSA